MKEQSVCIPPDELVRETNCPDWNRLTMLKRSPSTKTFGMARKKIHVPGKKRGKGKAEKTALSLKAIVRSAT